MLLYHISLHVYRLSNNHLIYIICISPQKGHTGYFCSKFNHEYLTFVNNIHVCSLICYFCHICKTNMCVEYYGIWPNIIFLNNYQWNTFFIHVTSVRHRPLNLGPLVGNFSSVVADYKWVLPEYACLSIINNKYYSY